MKTFEITLRFQDRKRGPERRVVKIDASGLVIAISRASRDFMRSLDRKQRFDVGRYGLRVEALLVNHKEE